MTPDNHTTASKPLPARSARRHAKRRAIAASIVAAIAVTGPSAITLRTGARAAHADPDPGVREITRIPAGFNADNDVPSGTRVDSVRHIAAIQVNQDLWLYDIEDPKGIDANPATPAVDAFKAPNNPPIVIGPPTIDEAGGRVFLIENPPTDTPALTPTDLVNGVSDTVSRPDVVSCRRPPRLFVLDLDKLGASDQWTTATLPCLVNEETGVKVYDAPLVKGYSYDAKHDKLLVLARPGGPRNEVKLLDTQTLPHDVLSLMQVDVATMKRDWQVDLTTQCDDFNNSSPAKPLVARAGDTVLGYCYVGGSGRAVTIPLHEGNPVLDDLGDPVVRVSPTVGGRTVPMIDAATGRILIFESKPPLGPAIWVYDAFKERFAGVIPSGTPSVVDSTQFTYYQGLDRNNGRAYIVNPKGTVVADIRREPLSVGLIFDDEDDFRSTAPVAKSFELAADSQLHRVVLPLPDGTANKDVLVLLNDTSQPTPEEEAADLDRGTADIPEAEGATQSAWSSASNGFGAHVLVAGGVPGIVNNVDPLCVASDPIGSVYRDDKGRCLADRLLSSGNREYFLAPTALEFGSESGAVGEAAAASTASGDSATDADLRSLANCLPGVFPTNVTNAVPLLDLEQTLLSGPAGSLLKIISDLVKGPTAQNLDQLVRQLLRSLPKKVDPIPTPQYDKLDGARKVACDNAKAATEELYKNDCGAASFPEPARTAIDAACIIPFHDWADGTKGGFPSRPAICTDFVSKAAADQELDPVGQASVTCDLKANHVAAQATTAPGGFVLKLAGVPTTIPVSAQSAESRTETTLTEQGMKTTTSATLSGVVLGDYTIGRIHSEVTTLAHGRSETANATYKREISQVSGPNFACAQDCAPEEFIDGFNQAMAGRAFLRLNEPNLLASPKGFQAVARKDPGLRASDRVANDDDTTTFDALDLIIVNDVNPTAPGVSAGRSRIVVGLAGVQAESRYGIFALPTFTPFPTLPKTSPTIINPTQVLAKIAATPPPPPPPSSTTVIQEGQTIASAGGGPPAVLGPGDLFRLGWDWFINHPLEALLLLGVMTILLSPLYFASRQRVLREAIAL
ncbi:MAG: hypothetical protein HYU28_07310 [Actinobacteria bacterium]|nr:hypothetical protein [Actinomycetota bacterium]